MFRLRYTMSRPNPLVLLGLVGMLGLSACKTTQPVSSNALPVDEKPANERWIGERPVLTRPATPVHKKKHKQMKVSRKNLAVRPTPTPTPKPTSTPTPRAAESSSNKARQALINKILAEAKTYLNTPYRWGGMSRQGIDCSGLTSVAYKAIGRELPRVAGDQAAVGKYVPWDNLLPGDLLFFHSGKPGYIQHTGIVTEVVKPKILFIHASSAGVRIDDLASDYWRKHFITGRRYIF
jgi:probable lipoprotein NlpC